MSGIKDIDVWSLPLRDDHGKMEEASLDIEGPTQKNSLLGSKRKAFIRRDAPASKRENFRIP
jgi:hypothetical protein